MKWAGHVTQIRENKNEYVTGGETIRRKTSGKTKI
jgi:hypothetical protein